MKYGFIKVAAASPTVTVADVDANVSEILRAAAQAESLGVRLLVTPELGVTGYTCGDLFLQKKLIDRAHEGILKIAKESANLSLVLIVGAPIRVDANLYNCAVVIYNGKILGIVPKVNIPNYGEFYELRHFTPAPDDIIELNINKESVPFGSDLVFRCDELPEFAFGCEICEDLWVPNPPSSRLAVNGATIICNLSASDETVGKASYRRELVRSQSGRLLAGYIYADAGCGESTTDMVFSGHDIIGENGSILAESKPFEGALNKDCPIIVSEIDVAKLVAERTRMNTFKSEKGKYTVNFSMKLSDTALTRNFEPQPFVPSSEVERAERCESILEMQSFGLRKRIEHAHSKSAVIGISGGLDSCLALLVSVRAMDLLNRPRTDVIAVTMPCFGTTSRTRSNAEILCERLGVSFRCVDIKAAVNQHFSDIGHDESSHDVVYENSQARERTQIIMDIANAENGLVIGTGDLSELALGWATYNGDHMSMYGVNASIPKTLVRHIVRYYADTANDPELSAVLYDILATPVSPELLPADDNGEIAQKTEDLVGPYELHDFFIYYFVRYGFPAEKIEYLANYVFVGQYPSDVIHKWLTTFIRRFFVQQFKRSCLPDGPKVGSVTLSPRGDWRMPSDAVSKIFQI
ncbi:MAG: NAD(+) synthase [Clostridiales bacterium]|nr:NAD(+) synthase [Clostridiales bacterium]